MIDIGLVRDTNNNLVPTLNFTGNNEIGTLDLAFMIFLLENGLYGNILREKLRSVLTEEQLGKVDMKLLQLHTVSEHRKRKQEEVRTLEAAKIPMIRANQAVRLNRPNNDD
jgi:hypothetical protein